MRIHRMTFAAIGPFAGEHAVDFDALGGSSLFLIDGPTGAGKTSVIDALVFAMFGEVAGRDSDKQRLRSAFANPAQESFAEVEFSCSAGLFKVRRTPEYQRPRKRGEGLVSEASTVRLWRSTGAVGWELMSSKRGEADTEVVRLVGLSRGQFLQTVVLPQGEFASFLSAESRDRQAVLERIFNTSIYSRIESILDERRKAAQAQRDVADRSVADAFQRLRGRLGDRVQDLTEDEEGLDDVRALIDHLVIDQAAAQHSVVALDQSVGELDSRLAAARERQGAERALARAEANLVAADAALATSRERAAAQLQGSDDAGAVLAGIDERLGALRLIEAEEQLVAGLQADLDSALEAEELVLADMGRRRVEQQEELPSRIGRLAAALARAVADAQGMADEAQAREASLQQARLDGMSAELALGLTPGEPCPVCGSQEHPQPTQLDGPAVSATELAKAAKAREVAQQHWHAVTLQQAAIGAASEGIAPAEGPWSPDDLATEAREVERRATQLAEILGDLQARAASMRATNAAAASALAELRARVEEAAQGSGSVQSRLQALTADRVVLHDFVVAVSEQQTRAEQVREAQEFLLSQARGESEDVESLHERVRAARQALTTSVSERDRIASLRQALEQLSADVFESMADRRDVLAATSEVMRLAALVRGAAGNQLAQPLSAYVVQTMFDEILVAANIRLSAMLDGRFELIATEEKVGRAHHGQGLGLMVRDLRTETTRRCSTMSGGETFCASLALALGLADIVTAHAGGIEIGLLLIDEGFGTLDGDRLDDVMRELLALKRGGRTVGVISHVSEMKKNIVERIDVRPVGPREGSLLTVSWDPSAA